MRSGFRMESIGPWWPSLRGGKAGERRTRPSTKQPALWQRPWRPPPHLQDRVSGTPRWSSQRHRANSLHCTRQQHPRQWPWTLGTHAQDTAQRSWSNLTLPANACSWSSALVQNWARFSPPLRFLGARQHRASQYSRCLTSALSPAGFIHLPHVKTSSRFGIPRCVVKAKLHVKFKWIPRMHEDYLCIWCVSLFGAPAPRSVPCACSVHTKERRSW